MLLHKIDISTTTNSGQHQNTASDSRNFNDDNECKEINNIFTNDCNSISACDSIKRITKCLQFYQTLSVSQYNKLLQYLDNNYRSLINDYNHILTKHIGDQKSIKYSQNQFEKIHNHIINHLKP
eukprot:450023_1